MNALASVEDLLPEEGLREWVDLLVRIVEAAGAAVIFVGALVALARFVRAIVAHRTEARFGRIRLGLGRYLALGLEFQLASDILSTAITPTFEEIGKLAAIALIRTVLNHFLEREIAKETAEDEARKKLEREDRKDAAAPAAERAGPGAQV